MDKNYWPPRNYYEWLWVDISGHTKSKDIKFIQKLIMGIIIWSQYYSFLHAYHKNRKKKSENGYRLKIARSNPRKIERMRRRYEEDEEGGCKLAWSSSIHLKFHASLLLVRSKLLYKFPRFHLFDKYTSLMSYFVSFIFWLIEPFFPQ